MVRRRLNSFNPTLRKVPPEILIMVASNLKINAALVTKATHVCHHWRVTLLSCPNLWTHRAVGLVAPGLPNQNYAQSLASHRLWFDIGRTYY